MAKQYFEMTSEEKVEALETALYKASSDVHELQLDLRKAKKENWKVRSTDFIYGGYIIYGENPKLFEGD